MIPRRPRKQMNEINVVPYIDVMLVLLIIFMVTAPLIQPGVVELPQVGQSLKVPVAPLEVTLREDGGIQLRDRDVSKSNQTVAEDELLAAVQEKQAAFPDTPVVIAADKDVRYEKVLQLMDLLQRNGVARVGLLAKTAGR